MTVPQVKSIHALARGLDVLRRLQATGPMSLADLHRRTGIPKASLLRILKTLTEAGAVWQRMADGAYIASQVLAIGVSDEAALVEAASSVLSDLTREVSWPSVLAVPRLTHMEVVETNASRTMIGQVPLGPVGFQVNMLRSASGRIWLASTDDERREATLERLRLSRRPGDQLARAPGYVEKFLKDARARGFALRDPDFGGDYDRDRSAVDDGRESLAVAIRHGEDVPGVINITWSRRAFARDKAIETFSGPLARAASRIAEALT